MSKAIDDFCVLYETTLEDLSKSMKVAICEGWQPYGSLICQYNPHEKIEYYLKEMVKYREE